MFTTDQIKEAHSKVKSGADFPSYIQEIKQLGVTSYHAYVTDGHVDYKGQNNFSTSSAGKYDALKIADTANGDQFRADLKAHQQGKTDYMTFCSDCAKSGIEKWVMDIEAMTCTYFDKAGNNILEENVPH